jgi:hypothetical protein
VSQPENTIIVSPDNRSRQQINEAVRGGAIYLSAKVLQYTTGSKNEGVERGTFATMRSVDTRANALTVS